MNVTGTVLKASIAKLTKVADAVAESQRPGGRALSVMDRGGLAVDMASAALTVKGLGPSQARIAATIQTDATRLLDKGPYLDQLVSHVEDGISALRGRLRYTPVE